MDRKITDILDEITIPTAEISFDPSGNAGRIDFVAALSTLLKLDEHTRPIFNSIRNIVLDTLTVTAAPNPESLTTDLNLKIDTVQINNHIDKSITVNNCDFTLDLESLKTNEDCCGCKAEPRGTVTTLEVKVEDEFLNEAIRRHHGILAKNGVKSIKITFDKGKIGVKGAVQKLAVLNFEIEISARIFKNQIILDIEKLNVLKILSIPSFVSDLVMAIAGPKIHSEIIEIKEKEIIIKPKNALPQGIKFDIKSLEIDNHNFLLIIDTKQKKSKQEI